MNRYLDGRRGSGRRTARGNPETPEQPETREKPEKNGFALIAVLLVLLVASSLVVAATTLGGNQILINRYHQRSSQLTAVADGGLERARALLNGNSDLYPDTGYAILEVNQPVTDASGNTIPGVTRSLYVGPTGISTGQFGVNGTIISIAEDEGNGIAIRRGGVGQRSFAEYAYFTDIEPSEIAFGGGDEIFGPVHTNDELKIYSSGATFHGEVTTAKNVEGEDNGVFDMGYEEYVRAIPMPETADLDKLEAQALAGGISFDGSFTSDEGDATMRILFTARDLNADGDSTDTNEGFIRIYTSNDENWVSADIPWSGMDDSENCGHYHNNPDVFVSAANHSGSGPDDWRASLNSSTRRCYLGGADELFNGFTANDGNGQWLPWPDTIASALGGQPDADYLYPISRALNANFKGVIFVDGDVIISGTVRGNISMAASGDIIIGDDITYATDPGLGTCNDLLGIFAGGDVFVADNTLNAPLVPTGYGSNWKTYDDTKDEFIHGIVLTLGIFTVEDYDGGATRAEWCELERHGRGCLYLTGGIIQSTRGAVGTIWSSGGGTGYVKRYSYDSCAVESPPPYFPTTGHFVKGAYYPVEPVGFSVARFYNQFQIN